MSSRSAPSRSSTRRSSSRNQFTLRDASVFQDSYSPRNSPTRNTPSPAPERTSRQSSTPPLSPSPLSSDSQPHLGIVRSRSNLIHPPHTPTTTSSAKTQLTPTRAGSCTPDSPGFTGIVRTHSSPRTPTGSHSTSHTPLRSEYSVHQQSARTLQSSPLVHSPSASPPSSPRRMSMGIPGSATAVAMALASASCSNPTSPLPRSSSPLSTGPSLIQGSSSPARGGSGPSTIAGPRSACPSLPPTPTRSGLLAVAVGVGPTPRDGDSDATSGSSNPRMSAPGASSSFAFQTERRAASTAPATNPSHSPIDPWAQALAAARLNHWENVVNLADKALSQTPRSSSPLPPRPTMPMALRGSLEDLNLGDIPESSV